MKCVTTIYSTARPYAAVLWFWIAGALPLLSWAQEETAPQSQPRSDTFIYLIILLAAILIFSRAFSKNRKNTETKDEHNELMQDLNKRYEQGEISKEEYEERKKTIE